MAKNQKGFALVEFVVVVLAVMLVGGIGCYAFSRHKAPTKTSNASTSHATAPAAGPITWLTYKSTHTPIQFSYPSNWKLTHGQETGTTLENVTFTGTNGFSMRFFLEKQHPLGPQNYMCTAPRSRYDTFLNDNYTMVLEGTSDVLLQDNSVNNVIASYCGAKLNVATPQTDFTFEGSYARNTSNQTAENYLKLPEVQTAKKIFSSFTR